MAESNFQFSLGPMPSSRTGAHLKKGNPLTNFAQAAISITFANFNKAPFPLKNPLQS